MKIPQKTTYKDPLDEHVKTVVDKTWNFAGRSKNWRDHIINAAMGLASESGEVLDEHKKLFFHKEKDRSDLIKEELGDCCYYLAKLLDLHRLTLKEVLDCNKKKLFERYGVNDELGH